jgi:hypothetical protein
MDAPPLGPELASLLWPETPEGFFAAVWERAPFSSGGGRARIAPLVEELGGLEVDRLLRLAVDPVLVLCRGAGGGAQRTARVTPAEARALYDAGMTLYFDLARELPVARRWIAAAAAALGQRHKHVGQTSGYV